MTSATEFASTPTRENESADPFSSDLFGSNNNTNSSDPAVDLSDPEKPAAVQDMRSPASWMARIPKISPRLIEPSFGESLPGHLPELLSKAMGEALGEVIFAESDRVNCTLESIAECDLFAESTAPARAGDLAIRIVFEPTQSNALVMIGGGFVRRMIDKIFGSSEYESSNRISPIEMAIAEFLAARVVARINDGLDNEFFSVGEVSLMPTDLFSEHQGGAKARIGIQTENVSQLFEILISRGFLSGLNKAGSLFDSEYDDLRSAKLLRTIQSVPLTAQIGSTRLDAATLSFLEPGDVVIMDESQLDWNHGSPRGELRLLAGAGANYVLTGDITTEKNAEPGDLRVVLKDISSREAVNDNVTAQFSMKQNKPVEVEREEGSGANDNGIAEEGADRDEINQLSASVENLQLRLRVELAGKKVSLRDINSLRVGQVIDLGRGPTDSVNLVTDGSDETVAVGELVDIDGRLGVRLTRVFL